MFKTTLLSTLLFAGLSASAFAAEPAITGLGQSWPNAPDVSGSANWHVYTFQFDNVGYIQVNDLGGQVYGAIAVASGNTTVLPIGNPAGVSVADTASAAAATGDIVYADDTVQIVAVSAADGTTTLEVDPPGCDPVECNTHR